MKNYRHIKSATLAVLLGVASASCVTKTNEADQRLQNMNYYIGLGGNAKAKEQLLNVINSAKSEVVGVFNDLSDTDVSSALIAKADAGLKVAIGGDQRNQNSAGFAALKALNGSNKFLTYKAASDAAASEPNQNVKNKILATRLNFNRLNRSLKFDASAYDGRCEQHYLRHGFFRGFCFSIVRHLQRPL